MPDEDRGRDVHDHEPGPVGQPNMDRCRSSTRPQVRDSYPPTGSASGPGFVNRAQDGRGNRSPSDPTVGILAR